MHGPHEGFKEAVARLLERCVANADVIVLHEQVNRGRTIIEKLEHHAAGSTYAVVLIPPTTTEGTPAKWSCDRELVRT